MKKNIKKVVSATLIAGLAVAPVAGLSAVSNVSHSTVAHAAEQAQSKHVVAKFVQNEQGNFVEVTATQDVQAAKVTISVDGKGQRVVNVGDLKKGETKLVPFNLDVNASSGNGVKALPKTAAVTEHVTISKLISNHLVRATVSYKYDDGNASVVKPTTPSKPGSGDKVEKDLTPGDRIKIEDLDKNNKPETPEKPTTPTEPAKPEQPTNPKLGDKVIVDKDETPNEIIPGIFE